MKQSLQLRLGQTLAMTPQLQQAIRLLQLSTVELNLEIQQALESNMMLEMDDEKEGIPSTEQSEEPKAETENTGGEDESPKESEQSEGPTDIPDELPVDSSWEDIYDGTGSYQSTGDFNGMEFENQQGPAQGLKDKLLWQINLSNMSDTDKVIATAIIYALSSDGYLTCDLEDLHESLNLNAEQEIELDEIEAVLHRVQRLDVAGIAARDLRECLLLQLQQCDPDTPSLGNAERLVSKHLDLLAAHDYNQLMRRMKLDRDALQPTIALIQSLNPRPGSQLEESQTEYVVPDVFVRKVKGAWQVQLNAETTPHLRVNPHYASMVRRADNSPDNSSLKAHLQEARWFIKSLRSRSDTLLRVATAIVERQQAFLEYGEEAMKPLVLHDIADAVDVHESTISRVTTRKFMHTPRGIFELKYFFSSHLRTAVGGECSSTAIRAVIKKMIAEEDSVKPLSDSKIAKLLSDQGIKVARRTVAKYRESMTIPPSNERKQLV